MPDQEPTPSTSQPIRLPPIIERSMNAQALLPSHRPLLDFFRHALTAFQSSSSANFQVVCTLTPHPRKGPQQLIRHRILATPCPSPPRGAPPSKLVVLDSSFNPPTKAHLRMARDAVLEELRAEGAGPGGRVRLLLLLAIQNADKLAKPAAFEQRLAMMWAFARDVRRSLDEAEDTDQSAGGNGTEVSIDVALSTLPYFHDKSAAIANSGFYMPTGEEGEEVQLDAKEPEQVIVVGYDTLIRILDPKYYGTTPDSSENMASAGTPMRRALDPFFKRARLRVTMRTDTEWDGRDEQASYVEGLLNGDTLEKLGGSKDWAKRIEIVEGRKEGKPIVSSTLAREAAQSQDWNRLEDVVTPDVHKWVEREKLYSRDP